MTAISIRSQSRKRTLLIYVGLVIVLGGLYLLHASMIAASCSSDARRIISPGGKDYAIVVDTACDNLGGSDVVTLFVHTSSGDSPIFVFDPSSFSAPIVVRWINTATIDVTVDRVQLVQKQIYDLNGISIRYHIGAVGEPVERLVPQGP
jgi:hypothetical protein